jgi:hypothetical protein
MRVEDIPMSPSVALLAVRQREPSTMTPEVPELAARCMLRYALRVAKNVKCPSNLERASQYIVVTATARINWAAVGNNLM